MLKKGESGKLKDKKRRIARKAKRRMWAVFEIGGFMARKGLWNVAKENVGRPRSLT